MNLSQQLREYIAACFTGLWLQSFEHDDALREIAQLCRQENWRLASWSIDEGLKLANQPGAADAGASDPLAAMRAINALANPDSSALLVLVNFHRFLNSAEIVQALAGQIAAGKQNRTFVVILSPVVQIPTELEKLITVVEHELPNREQLAEIARGVATENGELPAGEVFERVLDAGAGLTRFEAENAFSLSLVRHGTVQAPTIWDLKSQTFKKSGLLQIHRSTADFSSLGGLAALKAFCKRSLLQSDRRRANRRPRGVLLLGVPGVGKSAICKALGAEVGRPTLILDVGSLYGSLVGDTERNIRQALAQIDASAPAIVMLEEIEKLLSGVASSGQTDSGVSARLFGSFLTWLSDHESDVYVVASCNDISKLPPEFYRAERWDGIFFLDLPDAPSRRAIWALYLREYELDRDQRLPDDERFTGAEIKSCCRLAALLDVPLVQAAQNIVPVAVTAAESVERLRCWASGRCLSADVAGIYQRVGDNGTKPGRRVRR